MEDVIKLGFGGIVLAILVCILMSMSAGVVAQELPKIDAIAIPLDFSHADTKHAKDAPLVRRACEIENNVYLTFKQEDADKLIFLCQTPEGVGVRVLRKIMGKWFEITAYILRVKTLEEAIKILPVDMYDEITYINPVWVETVKNLLPNMIH